MDSAVEGDVLGDHLLQLIYNALDGVPCRNGILLIPSDGDLILNTRQKMKGQCFDEPLVRSRQISDAQK